MRQKLASICYTNKQNFAGREAYDFCMGQEDNVRATLASNLNALMHMRSPRWKQVELAKAANVSQRTISNMLRGHFDEKSGATLDRVDAVARVFNLRGWQLLVPGLPADMAFAQTMSDIVNAFILADDDGKELICRVAEREASFRKSA